MAKVVTVTQDTELMAQVVTVTQDTEFNIS